MSSLRLPRRRISRGALTAWALGAVLLAAFSAAAQQPVERKQAADFPAHARMERGSLGAEYLAHNFLGEDQAFVIPDYLVVDVGVFPDKGELAALQPAHFRLVVNGRDKNPLPGASPSEVAVGAVKYPLYRGGPQLTGYGGVGDRGILIGGYPRQERFPGDPGARRAPEIEKAPAGLGIERKPKAEPWDAVVQQALPSGEVNSPVRGFLYFPFTKPAKEVKSLVLIYEGPFGSARLKLK